MRRSGTLTIEFVGETYEVAPTRLFTFGRSGDLAVDTSLDLPSVVGVFAHEHGIWWVRNQTSSIDIHLLDSDSRSALFIAAGSAAPIPFDRSVLRAVVGPSTYELTLLCAEEREWNARVAKTPGDPSLNEEQRQLLVALAEEALRGEAPCDLPSNADVAERLGWRVTKLNRKLDHLCIKFDKLGVAGLRGSARRLATERRRLLVDHCLASGLITSADLTVLPASESLLARESDRQPDRERCASEV